MVHPNHLQVVREERLDGSCWVSEAFRSWTVVVLEGVRTTHLLQPVQWEPWTTTFVPVVLEVGPSPFRLPLCPRPVMGRASKYSPHRSRWEAEAIDGFQMLKIWKLSFVS